MPGLHIYSVMPADTLPAVGLVGIDGAPVRAIVSGRLAFWVSAHDGRPAPSTSAAGAHNRVVEAGMTREITPVPVRFGQWFDGREPAAAALAADAERWSTLLRRFAGHAEWGVRVVGAGPARDMHTSRPETGTAYMAALARRKAQIEERRGAAERVAGAVAARVAGLTEDTRLDIDENGDVVNLCHLVAWNDTEAYHTQVRAVRDEHAALRFLFTGPWPPYSFVE